ncbi:hypothetical protein [Pleionea sp. CnH1-48]|uniref:HD domain-containing protein n=1 Tax=Pleionea sp. CnH1-48 TaxID=2954494 RepID=UPI002096EDEA|nr:hypothetical protein [Pleionea sp. CnH1-48]MCO7225118.1 hypothetical protein [Pleionea sp. CnH1-48]
MSNINSLEQRWQQLFSKGYNTSIVQQHFDKITTYYNEAHRYYHTLKHIEACLKHFDEVSEQIDEPESFELALWYHDVIYSTRRKDNEKQSANLAEQCLQQINYPSNQIATVKRLINITAHPSPVHSEDEKLMVDIDLSILGAPTDIFMNYERNVRSEFRWVPNLIYKIERKKVLESFIKEENIYKTNYFKDKLEKNARSNIQKLIKSL